MSPAMDNSHDAFADFAASCDGFLDGRFRAFQPRKGPRAAIDALFLAAAIPAVEGRADHVLEAGMGSGVASLALAARVGDVRITGVEIQSGLCDLARRNAALNQMDDRITIVEADVTASLESLEAAGIAAESFDHVAANPPFLNARNARLSPDAAIARAHAVEDGELESWIRFLAGVVRRKGSITLIHRADALPELLRHLEDRVGSIIVFPLFPRDGELANRVIVQAIKGSRAPLTLKQGLILHEHDGSYTPGANALLRLAGPLALT